VILGFGDIVCGGGERSSFCVGSNRERSESWLCNNFPKVGFVKTVLDEVRRD
jgi:hypothetical protein